MLAMDDVLNTLNSQTDQVAARTSTVGREGLKRDLRRVTDEHKALTAHTNDMTEQLKSTLQKWNEFDALYNDLVQWLESTAQSLRVATEPAVDLETKIGKVTKVKVGLT
jgi:DNA-binding transcriptional regulator GbsR (MarR family)